MLQRIRAVRENEHGFTLIELLIVIVILGVLAGIVVFAVGGISDRGTLAACKSDKKIIEIAQEAYNAKSGGYAADIPALVAANLIKEAPSTDKYTITTNNTGAVTVAAGTGGAAPAGC